MGKGRPKPDMIEQLRRLIRDSGRPANAIAVASGVPRSVLSRFLRGQRDLSSKNLLKLAGYFQLHLTRKED
jgi:hypothetical protein